MKNRKLFIETYGCQMNFSDSEIVASILKEEGFETTTDIHAADVVFINTCSIRNHAEQRIRKRLQYMNSLKRKKPGMIIGLLGCMAERLKISLIEEEKVLDLVAGPDTYRDLPGLIANAESGQKAVNTILSAEETYADISPVRYSSNGVTAFISIMRGCENYCAYCIVPMVRGQERSRDSESIVAEARDLVEKGFREVTLLGQNVNSYSWKGKDGETGFAELLAGVAAVSPLLRVRFATSHPKDLSDKVIKTIAEHSNICKSIHLPVQSGSNRMLDKMNRKYTREEYLERISAIRRYLPDCSVSTDIITGFCDETEEDHRDTLSLMEEVGFDLAYMFMYSERPGTLAAEHYQDNVPAEVKEKRLEEIIALQQKNSWKSNKKEVGNTCQVLVEGHSKRSKEQLFGRNTRNKVVVFPAGNHQPGDYVEVTIHKHTSATLIGDWTGK
ncbi:MAG: tRNA (N6-isopentenyl adenosine(37)-C2)-methylthiotransferase MiaB [Syntrophothermus sp.]